MSLAPVAARLLVDARDRLGECALWDGAALWWTDIEGAKLCRLAADGALRSWVLPQRVGSFAFAGGSRLLLGLAGGIAVYDPERAALGPLQPVEAGLPTTRINDGRCDRQGRFVFGMYNPKEEAIGGFYRVHADLRIERLPLPPAAVGNGICFSPDGTVMYYTDSPTRTLWRLDYRADGRLGTPEVFVRLRPDEGFADGSCVDAEGGVWSAQWEGGCVVRYDPQGRETVRVALPVSRPTCPAFGGAGLDVLYLTSARGGLGREQLRAQPAAGGVFALEGLGWRGLPEPRFLLAAWA